MYSSKTLAERNNDFAPYRTVRNGVESREYVPSISQDERYHEPRPEYQHGKLEANPILVDVRHFMAERQGMNNPKGTKHAVEAALHDWGGYVQWVQGNVTTREQRTHAHRVLTLWLATFG